MVITKRLKRLRVALCREPKYRLEIMVLGNGTAFGGNTATSSIMFFATRIFESLISIDQY